MLELQPSTLCWPCTQEQDSPSCLQPQGRRLPHPHLCLHITLRFLPQRTCIGATHPAATSQATASSSSTCLVRDPCQHCPNLAGVWGCTARDHLPGQGQLMEDTNSHPARIAEALLSRMVLGSLRALCWPCRAAAELKGHLHPIPQRVGGLGPTCPTELSWEHVFLLARSSAPGSLVQNPGRGLAPLVWAAFLPPSCRALPALLRLRLPRLGKRCSPKSLFSPGKGSLDRAQDHPLGQVVQLPVPHRRCSCFACGQTHHHQVWSSQARLNMEYENTEKSWQERGQTSVAKEKPAGKRMAPGRESQGPAGSIPCSRAGGCTAQCARRWWHTQETHS